MAARTFSCVSIRLSPGAGCGVIEDRGFAAPCRVQGPSPLLNHFGKFRCFWLAALLLLRASAPAVAGGGPNIVFILADDLGYGDLGCYGHPTIRTPALDRMAAEGMQFTQFYSASSVCSPSRAALMTGRLPVRFGLNAVLPPVTRRGVPSTELTLGELLQSAGYATACIGKWHLGRLTRYLPLQNGFDRYFGLPYSNDMSRLTNHALFYRLRVIPPLPLLHGNDVIEEEPDQRQLTRRYTEKAVRFLHDAAASGKPFFLYLPHTAPHPPLFVGEAFRGRSARGLYGDSVEEIDWSTGEILRTIAELGLDENTLVMFTSDNGPWLAKHEAGGSAGLFREGKGSTWEGGLRVPLIARWPGHVPAGIRTPAFATMMDILPTLAALAGAALPDDRIYDGADISDVLFRNAPGREPEIFFWMRHELRAVRKGPWKLHLITNHPASGSRRATHLTTPLLYNVLADPGESHDLAAEHPDVVDELLRLIERHRKTIIYR